VSVLNDSAVLALGQRWLDGMLPRQTAGRMFLVGGAFKTLLHRRPPRDLDLWGADAESRVELLAALRVRGAQTLRDNPPFQESLRMEDLLVEVSYDTTQQTLENRIAGADLALSAVGCERCASGDRAVVHPLAVESLLRRRVLLLKPLANWKYALYTLERMHRYAEELGFEVPTEEEEYVWATFAAQTLGERQAMIRRYERVSTGVDAIRARAEAMCEASA